MKLKTLVMQMAALAVVSTPLFADDGVLLQRNMSQQEADLYACPSHGEHAFTHLMNFRVPAQAASGDLLDAIEYVTVDGTVYEQQTAKPIVSAYVFGPVIAVEGADGFQGHGKRDVYASVSLDDGNSWKTVNLSESANLSSFTTTTPIPVPGEYCEDVPLDWNSVPVAMNPAESSMVAALDVVEPAAAEALTECDGEFCITTALAVDVPSDSHRLEVAGFSPYAGTQIAIVNGVTGDLVTNIRSKADGTFETTQRRWVADDNVPCTIKAVVGEDESNLFAVDGAPENCVGPVEEEIPITYDYPGDNNNVYHAVAGNKILVAWQSRFCSSGNPVSSRDVDAIATYLGIDNTKDLYLTDLFGVEGAQGSIDYATEGFPQVGEMPFNCLWTARGVLREDPDALGTTEVVWFKNERITSGTRDLTRIETVCAPGGGCAITWQEDPVGLRPGEGEGPGTGWAGATTNSKTDIWYTYIPWSEFETVDCNGTPTPLQECSDFGDTNKPLGYVPFAVPMRLTNNEKCQIPVTGTEVTYCNYAVAEAYGLQDFCADTVDVPLGPQGTLTPICVNEDGLPNVANTAASRPRLNVQPRDSDNDGVTDDAWLVIVAEEDKGLGRFGFLNDEEWTGNLEDTATFCSDDPDADLTDNCHKADVGKDVFYFSFAMGDASSSDSEEGYGLLDNLVQQGAQINRPEINWRTGTMYPPLDTADMWDFVGNDGGADYNFLIMNTQIARRTAMMSQSIGKADASASKLLAMPLFKEGILNQGGPADIQAVRVVAPCTMGQAPDDAGKPDDDDMGNAPCEIDQVTANPYAPENLVCDLRYFDDGTNPYYPNGLCMLSTINLSGLTPLTCEVTGSSDGICPGVNDMTCVDDGTFGQMCSSLTDPENLQLFDKLLSWYECPGSNGTGLSPACYTEPVSALLGSNQDDQAWYMPLDVSKAHRGYLDGDFVMMLYAKSPNWKLNTVGNDRYELYLRRSFDGGETFTTTPSNFLASDGVTYSGEGTTTCETWRTPAGIPSSDEEHNCTIYAAGETEQSRNMSQLKSMAFTILDPRYAPNIPSMVEVDLSVYGDIFTYEPAGSDVFAETDVRRPDRFHIVYETGDNTTVAIGEGEPLNLNYGRGVMFGDHFQVWAEEDDLSVCYPSDTHGDTEITYDATGFCNEFDTLEGSNTALSEEASMTASAAGDFLYAVWGQINLTQELVEIDGNAQFRRVWWLDDYIPSDAWENLIGQGVQ